MCRFVGKFKVEEDRGCYFQIFGNCLEDEGFFTLDDTGSIFEFVGVEFTGGELSDLGVHPVLNCEHCLLNASGKHAFEETPAVAGFMAIF